MASNNMLENSSCLATDLRKLSVKVFHAPITFAPDGHDNPNKHLGILAGCSNDKLFVRGTWNAQICESMAPQPEDILIAGKNGLSAFPNTDLEEQLKAYDIETLAIGGFMANCCVESTMREACEKGFNVITLTDCVATTSIAGNKAAIEITYPFFSTPMNAASFLANLKDGTSLVQEGPPAKRIKFAPPPTATTEAAVLEKSPPHPHPVFGFRSIAGDDVYQVGPWFVDVRQSVFSDRLVLRSGWHELNRWVDPSFMCVCVYVYVLYDSV